MIWELITSMFAAMFYTSRDVEKLSRACRGENAKN